MEPTTYFVHEYDGQTTVHPVGLAAVLILGVLLMTVPRRYSVWPMIIMACFVPQAQRVVVFTLDFNMLRIMVLFGWARLLLRDEMNGLIWKPIDTVMVIWTVVRSLATIVRGGAYMTKLGYGFDSIGMYFLFRYLICDWDDLKSIITCFLWVSIPVASAFLVESFTARNAFAFFGGLPEITVMRQGRLRCQGAFAHPILAGCFWAAVLPLMAALWRRKTMLVACGLAAGCLIVATCASSTPVMGVLFCVLGGVAFWFRRRMREARWGVVIAACGLAVVMEKPIWHLIGRINIVSGSTSWHRYRLIQGAINHWTEWFLVGSYRGTDHWGFGMFDVTNYFVVQCLEGGFLQLALFIAMIALGFQGIGRLWRMVERDAERLLLSWGLGIALFVHMMSFIGVSYFGQIIMLWYLTLGTIGSLIPTKEAYLHVVRQRQAVRKVSKAGLPLVQCSTLMRD